MPEQSRPGDAPAGKTLVRGADGALYFVSKSDPPQRLTEAQAAKVADLIDKAEDDLSRKINDAIPNIAPNCTRNARVVIPEVFMD